MSGDRILDGRVALVTGAASGIGRAIALGLLADGAKVVGVDVNEDGLQAVADKGGRTRRVDVSDRGQLASAVEAAVAEHGRIDILFNNAGYSIRRRVDEMRDGEFERMIAVHVFAAMYGMNAAIPHMRANDYGRIVNTLSRGAEVATPGASAYSVGKAGLFALTRTAAAETRDADIKVNGLVPGPTNTGIWGVDRPELQSPEAVYPTARMLATLPADGPTGKVFWNEEEYPLMARISGGRS